MDCIGSIRDIYSNYFESSKVPENASNFNREFKQLFNGVRRRESGTFNPTALESYLLRKSEKYLSKKQKRKRRKYRNQKCLEAENGSVVDFGGNYFVTCAAGFVKEPPAMSHRCDQGELKEIFKYFHIKVKDIWSISSWLKMVSTSTTGYSENKKYLKTENFRELMPDLQLEKNESLKAKIWMHMRFGHVCIGNINNRVPGNRCR